MAESRSTQSSNKFGMRLPNAFPASENIKRQTSNFKRPEMSFSADSALEYLQRAHKKERLAHDYLISDPAERGKSCVAGDYRHALLELAPANFDRGRAFAAGNGVAAPALCDLGRKIARD